MRLVLAMIALCICLSPAQGARLVSQLSNDTVEITSRYAGERMTFFGSVEPDSGSSEPATGPFHVVVVIIGPTQQRVARRKTSNFGIWINTEQVRYDNFPGYFHVLSSGKLADITDVTTLTTNFILPEAHTLNVKPGGWWNGAIFGPQLTRLMSEQGLFGIQENAVNFLSGNVYTARLILPSSAPPGPYIAVTYVFKDGEIIARKSEGFAVRKIGFERFLARSAVQYPLLYGMACVVLALFTGWLGGVIFKR